MWKKKLINLISLVVVLGLVLASVTSAADPSLIGWWKFDGDTLDYSGLANHGTANGGPTFIDGTVGSGALDFDGTDDYVEVPSSSSLELTSALTAAGWIKADIWGVFTDVDPIVRKGGANNNNYMLIIADGLATLVLDGGDEFGRLSGDTLLNTGQWYHVAATWDGTTVRIYVDGVLDKDPPDSYESPIGTDTRPLLMGGRGGPDSLVGALDDIRIYNRALTQAEIQQVMKGVPPGAAFDPSPANEATDVPRDVTLNWTPGEFAPAVDGHIVYLSANLNDVNDSIGGVRQSAGSYSPPQRLDFETTYYWRVDEVNGPPDFTVYQGDVWSFTTEPVSYPIDGANITATASSVAPGDFGPEHTIDGSGLNDNDGHSTEPVTVWLSDNEPQGGWIQYEFDRVYKLHEMWVWNSNQAFESFLGYGLRDVTVEYSTDGAEWTTLADVPEFAQAPVPATSDYQHNTTVDLGGAPAKHVRLTVNSNWGTVLPQSSLSEVRFFQIPVSAREPSPDSGATNVDADVTLSWRAGREVATHDLYLSTDEQAVIDGNAPAVSVADASYNPALDLGTSYYWRIDEVNDVETPTTWESDVWSFTTQEFIVVDDFESYNEIDDLTDPDSNRIFEGWPDGYGVATNGAMVGNDPANPSYAETATVHGGAQSMPIFYSNTLGATFSEATRTFAVAQDWTKHGIQTLVLYFQGSPGNTGQLYVEVNGSKVVYDGDAADIVRPRWKQWNIDLASLGVDLQSVTTLAIGIDGSGAGGTLFFDDIRLYRQALPLPSEEIWIEAEAGILGTSWSIIDDATASGGKYIGSTEEDGDDSDTAPGAEWIATYTFDVAGGDYKIFARGNQADSDSFWFRITTATGQNFEDPDQPGTGWVRWNGMAVPSSPAWGWDDVHSNDHGDEAIIWTLPAGTHTLEVGKREDGTNLDAILIVDDVE